MRRIAIVVVFIALLLIVVLGGHVYLAQQLVWGPALAAPWRQMVLGLIGGGALLLVLQPLGERMLAPAAGRWIAWPASIWMGFAFFLLFASFAGEGLRVVMGAAFAGAGGAGTGAARLWAGVIVALALTASIKGARSVRSGPRLEQIDVRLPNWPAALDGFRIVQISDLHIGPILDRRFAAAIVARCNALRPDLLAVTGDLVDGDVQHVGDEVAPFAELRARHGVYFVTGNHDFYSGADRWAAHVEQLGFRLLRNRRVAIEQDGAVFDLAGVEDHHAHLVSPSHREDLEATLAGRDLSRTLVLLAHDPGTFTRATDLGIDLQLSGHTHGGQIWPFKYLVRLSTQYVAGHYRRGDAQLYVSRGTGFWGPAMRLGAAAEITEITIRRVGSSD